MEKNFAIEVKNLSKKFDDRLVVKHINLQVTSGEIFGVIGPNGSGKTTTFRMLCGLLTPTTGEGTCLGYDILHESKEIKQQIGYVPQYFGLYGELTVFENLLFIAELYALTDRKEKVIHMMDRLNLTRYARQRASTLSGGWKQRLSLAAALLHDPLLLLLDEPTASVDPKSRREFWELMHGFSSEGITILLSSHNMNEIAHCNNIAYVADGKLLMIGDVKKIIYGANLTTWKVMGENLNLLARQLQMTEGIDLVSTYFDSLHISGFNEADLMQALAPYMLKPLYRWKQITTTLEDVFVCLSKQQNKRE